MFSCQQAFPGRIKHCPKVDKWAGKEKLARLAARFSNATAAAFAGKRGCSQLEGFKGVLSSMTRLQSLDLSGLQYEIISQSTLASILRSVRSLRKLTLKEPPPDLDSTEHSLSAEDVVPHDPAAPFRTLEQFLLPVGEECPELEALHILPASSRDWDCPPLSLPVGDYEAACTQLIRKCPRLGVLDPLITDWRNLETPCSLDVSTRVGTNLSSVTLSYSSKDALADVLLGLSSLSSLRELKVEPCESLLEEAENPALQTAFRDFALSSPSELSALELVQTPVEKSAVH
jgi:hypothetical protein